MTLEEIAEKSKEFYPNPITTKDITSFLDLERRSILDGLGRKAQQDKDHSQAYREKMRDLGKRIKVLEEIRTRLTGGNQASLF